MFAIERWFSAMQEYRTVHTEKTFDAATDWVKTQKYIGDRNTYIIRNRKT